MFRKIVGAIVATSVLSIVALSSISSADINSGGRSSAKFNAFYDSSVTSYGYKAAYDAGRSNWAGISSKVAIGYTSSSSGLPDKYYVGNTSDPTLLGLSSYFDANGNPVAKTALRAYTTVAIYDNTMVSNNMTYSEVVSNISHELGHSLSLAHTTDPSVTSSVMFQGIQSIGPQQYDKNQLKSKWGI